MLLQWGSIQEKRDETFSERRKDYQVEAVEQSQWLMLLTSVGRALQLAPPPHVNKVQESASETTLEKFSIQGRNKFILLSLSTSNAFIFLNLFS